MSVKTLDVNGQRKKNYEVQVHLYTCKCAFDINQMKNINKEKFNGMMRRK